MTALAARVIIVPIADTAKTVLSKSATAAMDARNARLSVLLAAKNAKIVPTTNFAASANAVLTVPAVIFVPNAANAVNALRCCVPAATDVINAPR